MFNALLVMLVMFYCCSARGSVCLPHLQVAHPRAQRHHHATALCAQWEARLALIAREAVLPTCPESLASAVDASIVDSHKDLNDVRDCVSKCRG